MRERGRKKNVERERNERKREEEAFHSLTLQIKITNNKNEIRVNEHSLFNSLRRMSSTTASSAYLKADYLQPLNSTSYSSSTSSVGYEKSSMIFFPMKSFV